MFIKQDGDVETGPIYVFVQTFVYLGAVVIHRVRQAVRADDDYVHTFIPNNIHVIGLGNKLLVSCTSYQWWNEIYSISQDNTQITIFCNMFQIFVFYVNIWIETLDL